MSAKSEQGADSVADDEGWEVWELYRWRRIASTLADALFRLAELGDSEMVGAALDLYEKEPGVPHLRRHSDGPEGGSDG